jgi:tetratricopeptide (TPR) repeat protein
LLEPATPAYAQAAADAKKRFYSTLSLAEITKLEGNEFFKSGDIDKAIDKYTMALNQVKGDDEAAKKVKADLYANRAMCLQQRWSYSEVAEDCTKCLELVPNHIKALVRRAQAYEALEKYKASLADFDRAAQLAPDMEVAFKGAVRVRGTLRQMGMM